MASNKSTLSTTLFLSLNLLFFTMIPSINAATTTSTTCSIDTSTLNVCVSLLGLPKDAETGQSTDCCSLLTNLVDLEAAVCLCAAIKANILGIILDADLTLTLLLNACGRTKPAGYVCT